MFKKIIFLCLLFLLAFPLNSYAEQYAPFGLSWGASVKQIEAMGVTLDAVEDDIFTTRTLPDNMEWAETYALLIDKKLGLVRVIGYTGNILNDPSGEMGRRIYFRLKSELEHLFVPIGSKEKDASAPNISYTQGMTFYDCLGTGPCGTWFTNFVSGDINVQIILEALDKESGYVSVIYENSALMRKLAAGKK